MASENETVEDIVSEIKERASGVNVRCDGLVEDVSQDEVWDACDRIEAAHRREVAELTEIINTECRKCGECAKFGTDCNAGDIDGAEDTRACEKFVSKEVAELREFSNDMRTWFRLYYSCGSDPKSKWWRSCASCRRKRCPIHKWRKALEGANDPVAEGGES